MDEIKLPYGNSVKGFSSLEEMVAWMTENEKQANTKISPFQREHIGWGSYAIRMVEGGLAIFGYIYDEGEYPDEPGLETIKESHARNYRYGMWYSSVEPGGEEGSAHLSDLWPISAADFEMAKASGWELNHELAQQLSTSITQEMSREIESQPGLDVVDKKVMTDIVRDGWSCIAVFPTRDEPGLPFNYTVGLSLENWPELLIMGMDSTMMHKLLWGIVQEMQKGVEFRPNTYSDKVLKDLRAAFVEIDDPATDEFPMSMTINMMDSFHALQVVWPDANDRFPWHDDFDPKFADRQVLLGTWTEPTDG